MRGDTEITNGEDVIDSRSIIERIEYLRDLKDDERPDPDDPTKNLPNGALDDDEAAELAALESLAEECEGYCADWKYGETLIRDSYFEDYARELAEDIGAIDSNESWPCTCIDWTEAASQLKQDYTSADFDGVTYWFR